LRFKIALLWPARGPLSSRTTPVSECTPRSPAAPLFRRCRRPIPPLKRPFWGSYLNVRPRSAEAVHRIRIPSAQAQHPFRKATADLHRGHLRQLVCRASGSLRSLPRRRDPRHPARRARLHRSGWLRWSAHHRPADRRPRGCWHAASAAPESRSRWGALPVLAPGLIANPAPKPQRDRMMRSRVQQALCRTAARVTTAGGAPPRRRTAEGDDRTGTTTPAGSRTPDYPTAWVFGQRCSHRARQHRRENRLEVATVAVLERHPATPAAPSSGLAAPSARVTHPTGVGRTRLTPRIGGPARFVAHTAHPPQGGRQRHLQGSQEGCD
jgi:hypothetical protein